MTSLRVVLLLMALTLAACGGDPAPDRNARPADYSPVPDEALFAEIGRLPGVVSVELEHTDTFANPNVYGGTVTVAADEDPLGALDHAIAILRQGHWRALMAVYVEAVGGELRYTTSSLGLRTQKDLERRYGPQPGDGEPPATLP